MFTSSQYHAQSFAHGMPRVSPVLLLVGAWTLAGLAAAALGAHYLADFAAAMSALAA